MAVCRTFQINMAAPGGGTVKEVKSKAKLDNTVGDCTPVVLHFWASWCDASKHMDQVFSQLSTDFPLARFLRGVPVIIRWGFKVFQVAPSLHMVEVRKVKGDTLEFHKAEKNELRDEKQRLKAE